MTILLSEPEKDFTGGEFVLTEQLNESADTIDHTRARDPAGAVQSGPTAYSNLHAGPLQ